MSRKKVRLDVNKTGSGSRIDISLPYLIVMHHPVVTEIDHVGSNTKALIRAVHNLGLQTLWFWPNADVGSEIISHELRRFNDSVKGHKIRFLRDIPPREFISLLSNSSCLVGNSSSGIKECSYLGIPVVDIGTRQNKRLRANNVVNVRYNEEEITRAVKKQIGMKRYPISNLYRLKDTAKNIAKELAKVELYVQKSFV